jgi:hypothetical protein
MPNPYEEMIDADTALESAKRAYEYTIQKLVDKHCPIAIGDVVTVPAGDLGGHAHANKPLRIERRTATLSYKTCVWSLSGRLLKKDGSDSTYRHQIKMPFNKE